MEVHYTEQWLYNLLAQRVGQRGKIDMMRMKHGRMLVETKDELADFIETMKDDFIKNPSSWENSTLDRYLAAMASWVRSMDNYYNNIGEESPVSSPSWSVLADMIAAAKIYE